LEVEGGPDQSEGYYSNYPPNSKTFQKENKKPERIKKEDNKGM